MTKEQINEDYCSFEVAKLLKEKGFDIPINTFYNSSEEFQHHSCCNLINANYYEGICSAPTQSLALKWLKEVQSIYITSEPDINYKHCFYPSIYTMTEESWDIQCFEELEKLSFDKPEQAVEAALLYVLKNII